MVDDPDPLDTALAALLSAGVGPEPAIRRALASVRRDWGGAQAYIRAIDRADRDRAIAEAAAAGAPLDRIARETGASVSTVRRVIRRRASTW